MGDLFGALGGLKDLFSWINPVLNAASAIGTVAAGLQAKKISKAAAAQQEAGARQQDAASLEQQRAADYQARAAEIQQQGAELQRQAAAQQQVAAQEKFQIDQANVQREQAETAEKIRREQLQFQEEEAMGRAQAAASGFVYNDDEAGSTIAKALATQRKENERQLAYEKMAGISRADILRRGGDVTLATNLAQAQQMEAGSRATAAGAEGTRAQAAGTRAAALGTAASAAGSRAQASITRGQGTVALMQAIPSALTSAGKVYDWWRDPTRIKTPAKPATSSNWYDMSGSFPSGPTRA